MLQSTLLEHFKWLHRHPELSFKEIKTTGYIKDALTKAGVEILDAGLKTGCVAIIRGEKSSGGKMAKTIALRADIDALPITENTNLPYKSENPGCMHACGHDFHAASLLGTAYLLAENKKELAGNAKLVFQPAEEVSGGAVSVIETGILDDVAEIYGFHNGPEEESCKIAISAGATFSSAIVFKIEIKGKGGHGAMPHLCTDPVPAAAALICNAQTIVSRYTAAQDSVVLSFTHIESGSAWNIIPDTAFIEGTIRALGTEKAVDTAKRLQEVCKGIELIYSVKIDYQFKLDTPSTNNDPELCELVKRTAIEAGFHVEPFIPTMAAEDFAVYQQKIRGVFIGFSVKSPASLHNPQYAADTGCLYKVPHLLYKIAEATLKKERM
ncbi:MAG: S-alkyl-N-acetyl-metabolite deacetylase SndA [Termitinemataceae bacterium]|nr:MAG: S-alkyl-N-acetyl-metabolite deacetylase SndA [Termitinemataceae bacterium]